MEIVQVHFDRFSNVLNELIIARGQVYNPHAIAALLRSMPKSYGNLVMGQEWVPLMKH
jgi:hypothetical protein